MKKDYKEYLNSLRELIIRKESERRKWAKENWLVSGGRLHKAGRVFVPITAFCGIILAVLVSVIHLWTIPSVQKAVNNGNIFNPQGKADSLIIPYLIIVLSAVILMITASVRFIRGRYKKSPLMLFLSSVIITLSMFFRYSVDKDIMPEKAGMDGGEQLYFKLCLIPIVICLIIALYSLILLILDYKDKRYYDKLVEKTLKGISEKNGEKNDLMSQEEYIKAIDEYIKTHK